MNDTVRHFRDFFVSLKLTVVLLALSMGLVFAATLDQVNLGIWAVQAKYFHSFFVLWKIPGTDIPVPVYPGGYLVGGFLLANLLSAHIYRFKLSWKKAGILLVHSGLILLLLGEFFTGLWQEEFQMQLKEGETKNYSESYRFNELAIINTSDPKFDDVVAVPESLLQTGRAIQHPKLPFRVVVKEYYPNSALSMRSSTPGAPPSLATAGIGPQIAVAPLPLTYKPDERNWPAAFIELVGPEGSLGTWLLSPQLPAPQTFDYGGKSWRLALRLARAYKPFNLKLLKVTHDVYLGTDIPKNFASRLRLTTPDGREDRDVLIYMNSPLRYDGLTFYQQTMDSVNNVTGLQVVRNPSWLLPYISCVMMALGLIVQFGMHLIGFIRKRRTAATA
ncbi:MAG: cytochrome c biogenesis protein ResB [Opitutaceae bacterium]